MPPPAPVEEESSLQLYIIIGMALVIVGLAVAFLKQKKKAD
jgi:LPXTG-motif cell wall-anchored protein